MIVCGVELASSEARLVILEGTKSEYTHIPTAPPKIVLSDDANSKEVKAFKETIDAFLRENHVDKVAIKKRGKRGEYAGGPVSFKIEGLIQLYSNSDIVLISPLTINAAKRKHSPVPPKKINKYQHSAFETAFSALE